MTDVAMLWLCITMNGSTPRLQLEFAHCRHDRPCPLSVIFFSHADHFDMIHVDPYQAYVSSTLQASQYVSKG